MEIIGYLASLFIGITLGLVGGGGSILTVPILVYLFSISPDESTSYSLFIVGITALVGAIRHYRLGNLQIKEALLFALPSILSLLFIRRIIVPLIPNVIFSWHQVELTKSNFIMIIFAMLMLLASISMIRSGSKEEVSGLRKPIQLIFIGVMVGFVTGFLGAGGGFLIIPALLFWGGLNMKQAVGTSLLIIFINSTIGFVGDMIHGVHFDYTLLLLVTFFAIVGMFVGTNLSKKIDGGRLKPVFGWFVLVMGIYILFKELV